MTTEVLTNSVLSYAHPTAPASHVYRPFDEYDAKPVSSEPGKRFIPASYQDFVLYGKKKLFKKGKDNG